MVNLKKIKMKLSIHAQVVEKISTKCGEMFNTEYEPSRVQFEPGFYRWVETLSRAAERISCRMVFHGREDTTDLIRHYITEHHPDVRAE